MTGLGRHWWCISGQHDLCGGWKFFENIEAQPCDCTCHEGAAS